MRIGLAVTHEHPCLNTVMVQGMQQAVGGNRRSAGPLGSIHNQYPHLNHKDTKSYMNVSYMDVTF